MLVCKNGDGGNALLLRCCIKVLVRLDTETNEDVTIVARIERLKRGTTGPQRSTAIAIALIVFYGFLLCYVAVVCR